MSRVLLILFLSLIVLSSCSDTLFGDLVITNTNIIDVQTGEIIPNQDVVIIGDSIAAIKANKHNRNYEASEVVDGTDKYLIPGLWDMHTHTWWGYEDFFPLLVANGVTGIREMFGNLEAVKNIRHEIENGAIQGPDIVTSGPLVDGSPPGWPGSDEAKTPEEGREIVRKQAEEGAEFIKVYSFLEQDVFEAIADESNKIGVAFGGHIPRKVKVEDAVKAGQKFIEHFNGMLEFTTKERDYYFSVMRGGAEDSVLSVFTERRRVLAENYDSARLKPLINLLAENQVWIDPTSVVNRAFGYLDREEFTSDERIYYMPDYAIGDWDPKENRFLKTRKPEAFEYERMWYHKGLEMMKPMLEGGVKFLAGTDYPNIYCYPGFSLHDELQIFVEEAGFSPLEALQTATINPAIFLEKENELGTVESGKRATLVLLNANPLEDINNTRKIEGVILRGDYLDGDSLRADIEAIAAKNKLPKIREVIKPFIVDQDIEAGIAEYHRLRTDSLSQFNFDEEQLNTLGYELLEMEKPEEAIRIFKLNVEMYPDYANGFDSLGDGYLAIGDTTKTIEVWEKAIELGSEVTRERLKSIK